MHLSGTKVYIASTDCLEDENVFQALYQIVSKERRNKIDKLRFGKDKRLTLAAWYLLDRVLKEHGIEDYQIAYGENGKPFLAGREEIKFNLAHSQERVMCVLSEKETGCDVEKIRKIDGKVAKRYYTDGERRWLTKGESEEECRKRFFRLWTLKESFLKTTGLGMKLPMNDFSFSIEENGITVCQNVNGEQYYFKEYDLLDGYQYAVCSLVPEFSEIKEVF